MHSYRRHCWSRLAPRVDGPWAHTHTQWKPQKQEQSKKSGERKLLGNSRAVRDVFRSVDKCGNVQHCFRSQFFPSSRPCVRFCAAPPTDHNAPTEEGVSFKSNICTHTNTHTHPDTDTHTHSFTHTRARTLRITKTGAKAHEKRLEKSTQEQQSSPRRLSVSPRVHKVWQSHTRTDTHIWQPQAPKQHTRAQARTMRTANKNRARTAVKENSSGAAGQPWTFFGREKKKALRT